MRKFCFIFLILYLLISNCGQSEWKTDFSIVRHELDVQIEPDQQVFFAKDRIHLQLSAPKTTIHLWLDSEIEVDSVFYQGKSIRFKTQIAQPSESTSLRCVDSTATLRRLGFNLETPDLAIAVEIFFRGKLTHYSGAEVTQLKAIHNQLVVALPGQETVLVSNRFWYPRHSEALAQYQIAILMPQKYEVITVGKLISRFNHESGARLTIFEEPHPVTPISIFAGVYVFTQMNYGEWNIFSYFFNNPAGKAERYFDTVTHALDLYQQKLGGYPYAKFAVVAAPLPISQAFPSFCILDSARVTQNAAESERVTHFVCQNWWGQSVFCQPQTGDWTEGISTYLADHYEHERMAPERAADARYHFLREYALQVPLSAELPLAKCLDLTDPVQFATSQSKGMMFFHHLRKKLGETIFYDVLRETYKNSRGEYLSWQDLQHHFEKVSQTSLDSVFDAWVNRIESIQFEIKNAKSVRRKNSYLVSAEIQATNLNRNENDIQIVVPLRLESHREVFQSPIKLQAGHARFERVIASAPVSLQIDPEFDFFRRLLPVEVQPFFGQVLHSERKLVVLPGKINSESLKAYREKIPLFNSTKIRPVVKFDSEVTAEDLTQADIILFGGILENSITNQIRESLPPQIQLESDCFVYDTVKFWKPTHALLASLRSPFHPDRAILLYWGIQPEAILNSADEIQDLQNYGFMILREGLKVTWRQWRVTRGPLFHQF